MAAPATIDGISHLRRAGQVLAACDANGNCLREAVLKAALEFWAATFYSDRWPAELQRRRDALIEMLLRGDVIEVTVPAMDDRTLRDVNLQLRELATLAEEAEAGQPNRWGERHERT